MKLTDALLKLDSLEKSKPLEFSLCNSKIYPTCLQLAPPTPFYKWFRNRFFSLRNFLAPRSTCKSGMIFQTNPNLQGGP